MKKIIAITLLLICSISFYYCKSLQQTSNNDLAKEQVSGLHKNKPDFSVSPVLTPQEALNRFEIEEGFEVKLVASEPLVHTPVFITFDSKGRIWTVEMEGYMPDTAGTGEDIPNGKIVILEDKNNDGIMDTRKVFLDSLVLPRAICLIEDGILVAEPPRLWFYEIKNDKPIKKTLIDPEYAVGGNVEHQPNGLLRALDNWIYNAKSDKRYRKSGDQWLIEKTHFRGQWGLSQDNNGRLYYNHNSQNVLSDFFTPGVASLNINQKNPAGFNEKSLTDNRVYPSRPTTGVNRGYMEGILDENKKLVNFTAACGPLVYRGDLFTEAYDENIFVPEPSANLIKRNIIQKQGNLVKGQQAYADKEFLRSTDERFRPVSLHNAADGALYIVDMYRGIIQHKTYLTPYLKEEIAQRDLTLPLSSGRIYKVVPKNASAQSNKVSEKPEDLVAMLGHKNGWIRDFAQQSIIDRKLTQLVPALEKALFNNPNTLQVTHALWVLEGLNKLNTDYIIQLASSTDWEIRIQALSVASTNITADNLTRYIGLVNTLILQKDELSAPYLAFIAHKIQQYDYVAASTILKKLSLQHAQNRYVSDAIISGLEEREEDFLKTASITDTSSVLYKKLTATIKNSVNRKASRDPEALAKLYPAGAELFNSTCETCHGKDGNGVKSLGPPLNKSEWVTGDKQKLMAIVLFGLTGPIQVNGHLYQAPEIFGDMPGIGYDPSMKDDQIAELLSFIRNNWQNTASPVKKEEIGEMRRKYNGRQLAFTQEELEKLH